MYRHPTIRLLAQYVQGKVNGEENPTPGQTTVQQMENIIEDLVTDLPLRRESSRPYLRPPRPAGDTVLLTGSTGALGANVLAELLSSKQVTRVYALNRPSADKSLWKRQASSFEDRGIAKDLLDSDKLVLLECITSEPNLGLSSDVYVEVSTLLVGILIVIELLEDPRFCNPYYP